MRASQLTGQHRSPGTRVNGEKLPKGGMAVLREGDIVSFARDCPFQVTLATTEADKSRQ